MTKEQTIDLSPPQNKILQKILRQQIPNKTVWAFGSRVEWKASETSDLDLVAHKCSGAEIADLKEALEESALHCSVDVLNWEDIPDSFRANIKKHYVVVQQNTVPEGWRETILEDFCHVNPQDKILRSVLSKKVAMAYVKPFTKKIDEYSLEQYNGGAKFKNGDTIFASITPSLENGKVAFIDFLQKGEVGFGSTEFIALRGKESISDSHFLYYLATSPNLRNLAILSMTGTSGRQRVETEVVKKYRFFSPPLSEQKAIAEVLSSLDDKIDLLRRQNKTLEDMAQILFRKWFLGDAGDDWEEVALGDWESAKLIPSGVNQFDGVKKYFATADVSDIDFVKEGVDVKFLDKPSRANMETDNYSIWFARMSGEKKVIWFVEKNDAIILSTGFAGIKATKKSFPYILFFILSDKFFKQKNRSGKTKGVQPSVNNTDILHFTIAAPPEQILEEFGKIAYPLVRKIAHNQKQSKLLSKLRDVLLPKLVSGKVRVK